MKIEDAMNATRFDNNLRPGQIVFSYELEITVREETFDGRATLSVAISAPTREDDIILRFEDLEIKSVKVAVFTPTNAMEADFFVEDGLLHIIPPITAMNFIVFIEYSGRLTNGGLGLHLGKYNEDTYVAMNLHPTYARRVFPCMDDANESSLITFKFNNLNYAHVVSNTLPYDNSQSQFRPLFGPPNLWGMIAHNFINVNVPVTSVLLFGRKGIVNQDSQASMAINSFYTDLNEWTDKPYTEIVYNQDGKMNIVAIPDVSTDWNALSTVGIWEPYVFMEQNYAEKQLSIALPKIAESMAKQWFGYVIYPQNKRFEWVVSGLASYAGWEMMRKFHDGHFPSTQLDVNTLFVTDVIQEALLRDSYTRAGALEPQEDLVDEDAIRDHIGVNSVLKYKAPALMRMLRLVLGDANTDYIQMAASSLVRASSLYSVNSFNFIDAVNYEWLWHNNGMVKDFEEFLQPWIKNKGYPLLHIIRVPNLGVLVLQTFIGTEFQVPISYTTRRARNFDAVHPVMVTRTVTYLPMLFGARDWVLFNIQGQGYYRVNYDHDLWDAIIEDLQAPLMRDRIHSLNRATLVDDALNIARSGRLEYDIAFRVVLTMEHETEYAPWKAFVRSMDFLRKRLVAYVDDDENLDSDIYLRIIQKTIRAFEQNIGFNPSMIASEAPMRKLTRGLVMEHACKANYQPCISAAKNWFYNPFNNEEINPFIPHELRPAVYCTMVREGDKKVIEALKARMDIEPTLYERLVILESLACSKDKLFTSGLLGQTIAADSPYGVEERLKIFAAVAGSSYANANLALNFLRGMTSEIRKMYGGPEKLEEAIFILADNMVDKDQSQNFIVWVNSLNSNLDDSQIAADRAVEQVYDNLVWDETYMEYVYEWLAKNAN